MGRRFGALVGRTKISWGNPQPFVIDGFIPPRYALGSVSNWGLLRHVRKNSNAGTIGSGRLSGSRPIEERVRRIARVRTRGNVLGVGPGGNRQDFLLRQFFGPPKRPADRAQPQNRRGSSHFAQKGLGVPPFASLEKPDQRKNASRRSTSGMMKTGKGPI